MNKRNMTRSTIGMAALAYVLVSESAFAQAGRAVIEDPAGILQGNAKATAAVGTMNWLLTGGAIAAATFFTILCGLKCERGEYGSAIGSALGAVIAGIGGYLVSSFIG